MLGRSRLVSGSVASLSVYVATASERASGRRTRFEAAAVGCLVDGRGEGGAGGGGAGKREKAEAGWRRRRRLWLDRDQE